MKASLVVQRTDEGPRGHRHARRNRRNGHAGVSTNVIRWPVPTMPLSSLYHDGSRWRRTGSKSIVGEEPPDIYIARVNWGARWPLASMSSEQNREQTVLDMLKVDPAIVGPPVARSWLTEDRRARGLLDQPVSDNYRFLERRLTAVVVGERWFSAIFISTITPTPCLKKNVYHRDADGSLAVLINRSNAAGDDS